MYIHVLDDIMLTDARSNMSSYTGLDFSTESADVVLNDGEELEIIDIKMKIIHLPGHTKGGIAIHIPEAKVVFTGDCVFAGSIGRTDFPGYDEQTCREELIDAIKKKLLPLTEDTKLYPGHGPATTIRCEKKHNPYLAVSTEFV